MPAPKGDLASGPRVRSERAALRRRLAADGAELLAGIVAGEREDLEVVALPMTIGDLLGAVPRLNVLAVAANGNLLTLDVRLRDLPVAQRSRLAAAIRSDRRSSR